MCDALHTFASLTPCLFARGERHLLQVNDALKEEMQHIHALSIKKAQTPAQAAAAQPQQ